MIPLGLDWLPRRRVVPPPEPPLSALEAESAEREKSAQAAAWAAFGDGARRRQEPAPAPLLSEGLDPLVFWPPGTGHLQNGERAADGDGWRSCPCGVTWRGGERCWACGVTG